MQPTGDLCGLEYRPGHESCTRSYVWPAVIQLLGPANDRHLLDAGCGGGSFCEHLESLGFHASGFDTSESAIAIAADKVRTGRVVRASAYDDLRRTFGRRFDAVTALEVIEHLYDPRAFLRRVRDLLAPGAPLVLSTPHHGFLKNLALAVSGKLDDHFTVLWDGGHIKFFSARTIRRMLEECGYRVVQIRGVGRLPGLWKSMVVLAVKTD